MKLNRTGNAFTVGERSKEKGEVGIIEKRAEDLQAEVDTIVVEGSSSVEASRARISLAETVHPTLKDRLDTEYLKVTEMSEETPNKLQLSYDDSIIKLLQGYCALRNEILVKVRENSIVDIGVFYSQNKIAQYTMIPDADGWYRLRDVVLKDLSNSPKEPEIINEVMSESASHKNFDSTTGGWTLTSPISSTTQVGATFTASFNGTGFFFSSFTDARGGIWEFEVDGVNVKTISVWSASQVSNVRREIIKGLPDGNHTIVATFKGDDPNNVPVTGVGTARGWANNNTTASSSYKTIAPIVAVYEDAPGILNLPVKQEESRQEFAYQVSPSESETNYVWVPEHGVSGVMKDIVYDIYFGDVKVTDLSTYSNNFQSVASVKIITRYNAYYPGDPLPLWKGRIDQTINGYGFHVSGKMKFLRNTYIRNGYAGMWAASKTHTENDRVVTSKSKRYTLPKSINDGSNVTLTDVPSGVAHFTKESSIRSALNAVAAVELHDYSRVLRLGEPGAHPNPVRVDLRTDGQRKTYMASHRQTTVPAGETFTFTSRYFACEVKESADILA